MVSDPFETTNLIASPGHAEVLARLKERYQWYEETLPVKNGMG